MEEIGKRERERERGREGGREGRRGREERERERGGWRGREREREREREGGGREGEGGREGGGRLRGGGREGGRGRLRQLCMPPQIQYYNGCAFLELCVHTRVHYVNSIPVVVKMVVVVKLHISTCAHAMIALLTYVRKYFAIILLLLQKFDFYSRKQDMCSATCPYKAVVWVSVITIVANHPTNFL